MTLIDEQMTEGYRYDAAATVHDVDDKTHMVAVDYPIVVDSYRSDFGPGAFEESWRRRLPPMHVDHGATPVGRAIKGQSLSDRHRLVGRFDDGFHGQRAFEDVRDGVFPGWSWHYRDGQLVPHPSGQRGAVRIAKATMTEFGPVRRPAIPGTRVVGLRSAPPESWDDLEGERWAQAQDAFNALRRLRSFPDDQGTVALRALQGLRSL